MTTRAQRSPKTPVTVRLGRKSAKRYVSSSRRWRPAVGMPQTCHVSVPPGVHSRPLLERVKSQSRTESHPLNHAKTRLFFAAQTFGPAFSSAPARFVDAHFPRSILGGIFRFSRGSCADWPARGHAWSF